MLSYHFHSFIQHTADFISVLDLDSHSASFVVNPDWTIHNSWCCRCAGTGTDDANSATAETLKQAQAGSSAAAAPVATWQAFEGEGVSIAHRQPVTYLTWHAKGDYFASVSPTGSCSPVFHGPCTVNITGLGLLTSPAWPVSAL